jgi:hypothetical protein
MGSHKLFGLGWPGTMTVLISAFQVVWDDRHTHHTQLLVEKGTHLLFA